MENNHGPCLDKNCSWCCNPVKINQKVVSAGDFEIPKDKDGNYLWKKRDEVLAPLGSFETTRIQTFDCKNFDRKNGKCLDYENRPEVCKNTSCIKDKTGDIDEQHKAVVDAPLFRVK